MLEKTFIEDIGGMQQFASDVISLVHEITSGDLCELIDTIKFSGEYALRLNNTIDITLTPVDNSCIDIFGKNSQSVLRIYTRFNKEGILKLEIIPIERANTIRMLFIGDKVLLKDGRTITRSSLEEHEFQYSTTSPLITSLLQVWKCSNSKKSNI